MVGPSSPVSSSASDVPSSIGQPAGAVRPALLQALARAMDDPPPPERILLAMLASIDHRSSIIDGAEQAG
ncbi:hypothetical protein [Azotobacter chroococcum]|uniref:hypothetical protein n=1 Tax=Azotobacter chroococcum TaxID=353 RepID=UPI0010AE58BA|nr:hypothetical protein [Azotobacter chroococcum]TKD34478.1 hypothetical protein FCG41_19535 [Azotobacter chroococcum]